MAPVLSLHFPLPGHQGIFFHVGSGRGTTGALEVMRYYVTGRDHFNGLVSGTIYRKVPWSSWANLCFPLDFPGKTNPMFTGVSRKWHVTSNAVQDREYTTSTANETSKAVNPIISHITTVEHVFDMFFHVEYRYSPQRANHHIYSYYWSSGWWIVSKTGST